MVRVHEELTASGPHRHVRIENGDVEIAAPLDFGPRILRYNASGGRNVFAEIAPETQRVETRFGEPWHIYGGHRLWYAPEHPERSYVPDNRPIAMDRIANGVRLRQDVERESRLEKLIDVQLDDRGSHVVVTHTIRNHGTEPIELAPWALTAMAPGGTAIFPHPPFRPHPDALAPARPIVLWPFTRMNDPRWTWGERFVLLRQEPSRPEPQKAGFYDPCGYMAYVSGDILFLKRHTPLSGQHADFGCNVETFTNERFLELETLGPLVRLDRGGEVTHVEDWWLFTGMEFDEAAVAEMLKPVLSETARG